MRVFLTGATGFIGGHILRALVDRGHQVTCLVRPGACANLSELAFPVVVVAPGEFTQPAGWLDQLKGHDAVVNAVGIIREEAGSSFTAVHTAAPIAMFEAAASAGMKIVQISALGADGGAQSRYHLSKRAADQHLEKLGVPYVILRPSFVYGPGDQSMSFFQSLAALPFTLVPGDGQYRIQPVHVDDVVRAVVKAVENDAVKNLTVDVGGKTALTFDEVLDVLARQLGKSRAWKVHVPWKIMELIARFTDARGGRGPITSEELGMLRRGSVADNGPFIEHFGFEPVAFPIGIRRKRLSQADRWYARLRHVRVPLRLSVAFIWLGTGILSATVSASEGLSLLKQIGIDGPPALILLWGTSLVEIVLGLATAAGWRVRTMGTIQIVLILGFTAILSATMPRLWLEPFGPLTKNIPLLGATLAMMALEE